MRKIAAYIDAKRAGRGGETGIEWNQADRGLIYETARRGIYGQSRAGRSHPQAIRVSPRRGKVRGKRNRQPRARCCESELHGSLNSLAIKSKGFSMLQLVVRAIVNIKNDDCRISSAAIVGPISIANKNAEIYRIEVVLHAGLADYRRW